MSVGYGQDTYCDTQLRTGRVARGIVAVGQAALRRQITPRGTLRRNGEAVDYGIDLEEYLGGLGATTAAAALPALIRTEVTKDDRVADIDVRVAVESNPDGSARLRISERIFAHGELESYQLTLLVSTDGVSVVSQAVSS